MMRERQRAIDGLQIVVSGPLIGASYLAAYYAFFREYSKILPFQDYAVAIATLAVLTTGGLAARKFSVSRRFSSPAGILGELAVCFAIGALGYGLAGYALKMPHVSRLFLLGGMTFSYGILAVWHLSVYWFYRKIRTLGLNYRNAVIVGTPYTAPPILKSIGENRDWGLKIIGIMGFEEHGADLLNHPYLGSVKRIEKIADTMVIDYVIFTLYRQDPAIIERAMLACQERGIEVWLKPDFMHKHVMASRVDYLEDTPLFVFSSGPPEGAALLVKRLFDLCAGAALLAVAALPMLLLAVMVRSTSRGEALFAQERIGLNGRKFRMHKFRTMYSESGSGRAKLKNELTGPVFKMKNDPRVTRLGSVLRKYSLDELPQLWNVLRGDMSLVGPRPPIQDEVAQYRGWQRRRLSMRPGLTGLWQVMGRNDVTDFSERAKLDLRYIDEWSLWLDAKILFKTIPVVLRGTGQ